jgi:hypothetical protein
VIGNIGNWKVRISHHSINSKLHLVLESVDFPQFLKSTPHVPRGSPLEAKELSSRQTESCHEMKLTEFLQTLSNRLHLLEELSRG